VLRCQLDAEIVARGFGASDCRCPAHLVRVTALPDEEWFAGILGAERIAVAPGEMDELLEILVSAGEDSREEAALALGRYGAPVVPRLTAILDSGGADDRWWATRALAEVKESRAVSALLGVLDDPDPDLRACAVLALGRVGDASAAPFLAERLGDESTFVASIAADALSMLGEGAVEAVSVMLGAKSPHTRLLAARALGRIGSRQAIGPLFEVLEDPSYLVRHCAHEALEALGVGMVFLMP